MFSGDENNVSQKHLYSFKGHRKEHLTGGDKNNPAVHYVSRGYWFNAFTE
jgi:hypothetical protein